MIYLLVDLKIVLALHPSDQNRGWYEGGAYQNLKPYGGGGALNRAGVLTRAAALNRGNTVCEHLSKSLLKWPKRTNWKF